MNLYKTTWESNVYIPGLYSPQFIIEDSELKALSKLIKIFEEKHPKLVPTNIKVEKICEMEEIIR